MKRSLVSLAVAIVVAGLLISGCAPAAPAPAPTQAPAQKAAEPTKAPAAPTTAPAATSAPAAPTKAPAAAVDYPQKGRAISVIVPYAAGGATDISARTVLPAMERIFGSPIQVANKGGGGSQVGNSEVAKAKPDGYTIAYMALPTIITSYLDKDRKAVYTRQSFAPIGRPTADTILVAVKADSPFKTMKEFVEAARANPEKVKVAVSGPMSVNHLPLLMIEKQTGVKFAPVHFDGSRPGITAMLGGHVDAAFALVSEIIPQFKAGEVRVLGVMDSQETEFLPGVPTLASQGYPINMLSSHGIAAPAGTPKEVVTVWSTTLKKVLEDPEVVSRLKAAGQLPRYLSAEDFARFWEEQDKAILPLMELAAQK